MLLTICPVCGQDIVLAELNLLLLFERYLLMMFVLSLAVRYQQYRAYLGFLWAVPDKWPSMYTLLKKHLRIFRTWTMLVPVGIALGIYVVHFVSQRLIWREAAIDSQQLASQLWALVPVALFGGAMLYYDLRAIFSSSRVDFNAIETSLKKGEFALTSRTAKVIKFLTFNRLDVNKLVESRVTDTLFGLRLAFMRQLRQQSFHTILRIAFGCLLWTTWARVVLSLSTILYLIALASLIALLVVAWRWTGEGDPAADAA